jgi:cytoskeletal protein RodZ
MARRWILTAVLAAVLVVAAVFAAHAIRDDETAPESATGTTATTAAVVTTTTTVATTTVPATTTTTTTATTATTTTGPPGPCGTDAGPIRVAIDAAVNGAGNADVDACRLAASDPTWAAVHLVARPGAQFAATTVIVHGGAGSWSVVAQGGTNAGCGQAPQQVIVDLGQFCAGTGGNGAQ